MATPSVEGMIDWLTGKGVMLADGGVLSWENPAHPGYPYPEAAGLLLSLLAHAGPRHRTVCTLLARRLSEEVSPAGGYGRCGSDYVFDTAVVLSALLEYERTGSVLPNPSLPQRLLDFIVAALTARRVTDRPVRDASHWSVSYGCHLLKVVRTLTGFPDPRGPILARRLLADLAPLADEGRFRVHESTKNSYLHAHCYAVEGLLCLQRMGITNVHRIIEQSADWLAHVQTPAGGFHAWHDGTHADGKLRADATAQAVRIWACVDRRRFAPQIALALEFLANLQSPSGGLWYEPGCADVNTWATVFAVQAVYWAAAGGVGWSSAWT